MTLSTKQINENDYPYMVDIYNYYILNSTATFHTEPLDVAYFKSNIPINHPIYKAYIVYMGEKKVGFCYFSPYINRPAYKRTAEISIYLDNNFIGQGIGTNLIQFMKNKAKELNFSNLLGLICEENTDSIKLFVRNGFEKVAHLRNVGEKFNRTLSVHIYQLEL